MKQYEEILNRMKAEIIADMSSGVVPNNVRSFSELHDYVDANCYGGFCDKLDVDVDMLNSLQCEIDHWLRYMDVR
jgi:hypothetical protein